MIIYFSYVIKSLFYFSIFLITYGVCKKRKYFLFFYLRFFFDFSNFRIYFFDFSTFSDYLRTSLNFFSTSEFTVKISKELMT